MGIKVGGCSSMLERRSNNIPNPDPLNFEIIKHESIGSYLLVMINYPDCTNYEGNKIMIYKDLNVNKLKKLRELDPHFSNTNSISPLIRIKPSKDGWNVGIEICKLLNSNEFRVRNLLHVLENE